MRNEKKRKKIKIIIAFIAAAAVLMLGFSGFEIVKRARISNFHIRLENITCTDQDQVEKFLKDSNIAYFSYAQDNLYKELKKKFFCIGKINTKVSYPDKLFIEAWGREAVFAVRQVHTSSHLNPTVDLPEDFREATDSTEEAVITDNLGSVLKEIKQSSESAHFLVDKEGMVFEKITGNINFPVLKILGQNIEIGKEISNGVIEKTSYIISKLNDIKAPADNIIVIGDKLVIDSKPRIIFSLKKRLDYQTASLQLILAQAKMNSDPQGAGNGDVESIDLRFNKPVVVYTKK